MISGHNCSGDRSVLSAPGFRMPIGEKHPSHSFGTEQESTVSALVRENNESLA